MQSSIPSGESFVIVDIDCQIAASLLYFWVILIYEYNSFTMLVY